MNMTMTTNRLIYNYYYELLIRGKLFYARQMSCLNNQLDNIYFLIYSKLPIMKELYVNWLIVWRWSYFIISWQEGVPHRNLLFPTFSIPLPLPTPGTRIQDNGPLRFDRTRTHDANISVEVNAFSELWSCDPGKRTYDKHALCRECIVATFREIEAFVLI